MNRVQNKTKSFKKKHEIKTIFEVTNQVDDDNDSDIEEISNLQNSVDELLLRFINVKDEVIDIEESKWDQVVISNNGKSNISNDKNKQNENKPSQSSKSSKNVVDKKQNTIIKEEKLDNTGPALKNKTRQEKNFDTSSHCSVLNKAQIHEKHVEKEKKHANSLVTCVNTRDEILKTEPCANKNTQENNNASPSSQSIDINEISVKTQFVTSSNIPVVKIKQEPHETEPYASKNKITQEINKTKPSPCSKTFTEKTVVGNCIKNKDFYDSSSSVIIKQERIDETQIDSNIESEHAACLQELSKVFEAPKHSKTVELTGISLVENVIFKEEEEEYIDDIIILRQTPIGESEERSEETASGSESETEFLSETQRKINSKKDKYSALTFKNNKKKKLYRCKKCNFVGVHRKYLEHRLESHTPKKHWFNELDDDTRDDYLKTKKLYHCKPCNYIAPHLKYLKHLTSKYCQQQTNPKSYSNIKCTKCNTAFVDVGRYFAHFTEHNLKYGACPKCFEDFSDVDKERQKKSKSTLSAATKHLTWHVESSYTKIFLLNESSYETTLNSGLYQCKSCSEKVSRNNFFEHWEKHLDLKGEVTEKKLVMDDSVVNTTPGRSPFSPEDVKTLLNTLVLPKEKVPRTSRKLDVRCKVCARTFNRRNDWKRHVIEHLLLDARSRLPAIVCQLCSERFSKADEYRTHMRHHAGFPLIRCEICDHCFSDSSNFAKHKKKHIAELFTCDICKKKYAKKDRLAIHIATHRSNQPLSCPYCDRKYFSESDHRKHVRIAHLKEKSQTCPLCCDVLPSCKAKYEHMWVVHRERRYKADCPLCKLEFRKYQDVRDHLNTAHHRVLPFSAVKKLCTKKTANK